jgi:hypothetical protein
LPGWKDWKSCWDKGKGLLGCRRGREALSLNSANPEEIRRKMENIGVVIVEAGGLVSIQYNKCLMEWRKKAIRSLPGRLQCRREV